MPSHAVFIVLWRSAFQARRLRIVPPGTSYPVTVAALRSAFQALRAAREKGLQPAPTVTFVVPVVVKINRATPLLACYLIRKA